MYFWLNDDEAWTNELHPLRTILARLTNDRPDIAMCQTKSPAEVEFQIFETQRAVPTSFGGDKDIPDALPRLPVAWLCGLDDPEAAECCIQNVFELCHGKIAAGERSTAWPNGIQSIGIRSIAFSG